MQSGEAAARIPGGRVQGMVAYLERVCDVEDVVHGHPEYERKRERGDGAEGEAALEELLQAGKLPSRQFGRSRRIPWSIVREVFLQDGP